MADDFHPLAGGLARTGDSTSKGAQAVRKLKGDLLVFNLNRGGPAQDLGPPRIASPLDRQCAPKVRPKSQLSAP
jgi:hypothetical protein